MTTAADSPASAVPYEVLITLQRPAANGPLVTTQGFTVDVIPGVTTRMELLRESIAAAQAQAGLPRSPGDNVLLFDYGPRVLIPADALDQAPLL